MEQTGVPEASACCSSSSPDLGALSFPAGKATRAFLPWKCGACAALLTPGLQSKARISLGNNYFRALGCNKAWIKPDGLLVRVGMRNNQFCVLEGEGNVLESRSRDPSVKIPTFGTNLLDVVGFVGICFQVQEDAGAGIWLVPFHVPEKMPCENHEASNGLVSCGNERNTRFHWVLLVLTSERSFCESLQSVYREQKSRENRVRVLTRIVANVGFAFMSYLAITLYFRQCLSGNICHSKCKVNFSQK